MRPYTCIGFAVVSATLVWLTINQQRMSRELRILFVENRRLTETVNQQLAMASAPPTPPQPLRANRNDVVPGKPAALNPGNAPEPRIFRPAGLAPNTGFQTGLAVSTDAGQLSSHSADGKLLARPWGP